MLIAVVAVGAIGTYDALAGGPTAWGERYWTCVSDLDRAVGTTDVRVMAADLARRLTAEYVACNASVDRTRALLQAIAVTAVLGAMVVGYVLYPRLVIRRQALTELDDEVYRGAAAQVSVVLAEDGLLADAARARRKRDAPPELVLLVDPLRGGVRGRVFGRGDRFYVRLNRGLVHRVGPEGSVTLRAVLRHELAHLANRDIGVTTFTVVSAWAYLLVALPAPLVAAWQTAASAWSVLWRWAVVIVAVLLIRASIFRVREHYADVRAAQANANAGDPEYVREAFPDGRSDAPDGVSGWVGQWLGLLRLRWRFHPPSGLREAVVKNPDRLMAFGFGDALATGFTASLLHSSVLAWLTFAQVAHSLRALELAGFIVAPLVVGVLGGGLGRCTLAAMITRSALPRGTGVAAGLALGLSLGQVTAPALNAPWYVAVRTDWPAAIVVAIGLFAGCLVFARWCVVSAASWLPVSRSSAYVGVRGLLFAAGSLAVGAGLAWWQMLSLSVGGGTPMSDLPIIAAAMLAESQIALPVLVAAAVPLLASLVPRAQPGVPLAGPGDPAFPLPRPQVRWRAHGVMTVVVAGAVAWLDRAGDADLLSGLFLAVSGWSLAGVEGRPHVVAVLVLVLGALTAVALASGGRRGPWLAPAHTLLAGVWLTYLAFVVLLVARILPRCELSPCTPSSALQLLGTMAALATIAGTVTAVVVASVVAAIRRAVQLFGSNPRWPAGSIAGSRAAPRRERVVAPVVALAGVCFLVPLGSIQLSLWFPDRYGVSTGLPGEVIHASPAAAPGTLEQDAACTSWTSVSATMTMNVTGAAAEKYRISGQVMGSTSPALRVAGRALRDALASGDPGDVARGVFALSTICDQARRKSAWAPSSGG